MKKANILRLLALMLALVMVLGCFVGCDDSGNTSSDKDDEEEEENVEDLRDGLKRHKYDGMTFYLSEDFEEEREDRWTDGDLIVEVTTMPVSRLDGEVDSAKELRDMLVESYEDELDEKPTTGKKNGVYYIVAEDGDETAVMGLYLTGSTVGMIAVVGEDVKELEDDMILYATLGKLKDYYEDYDEDEDEDDGGLETTPSEEQAAKPDLSYTQEFDLNGLHYFVPAVMEYPYDYSEDSTGCVYRFHTLDDYIEILACYGVNTQLRDIDDLLQQEREALSDMYDSIDELYTESGVPVLRYRNKGNDFTGYMACHFYEGRYWTIDVVCHDLDVHQEDLMSIVSKGWIVEDELPELPLVDVPVEATEYGNFQGLDYFVPRGSELDYEDEDGLSYTYGDMTIMITWGLTEQIVVGVSDSWTLRDEFAKLLRQEGYDVETDSINAVPVLSFQEDGMMAAGGFYCYEGYCWIIEISCPTDVYSVEELYDIVGSGYVNQDKFPY